MWILITRSQCYPLKWVWLYNTHTQPFNNPLSGTTWVPEETFTHSHPCGCATWGGRRIHTDNKVHCMGAQSLCYILNITQPKHPTAYLLNHHPHCIQHVQKCVPFTISAAFACQRKILMFMLMITQFTWCGKIFTFMLAVLPLVPSTHHSYHLSPPHSFTPGIKPSFSANPSHRSLPFLLPDWRHGFPGLFTDTSECMFFSLVFIFPRFSCWFHAVD